MRLPTRLSYRSPNSHKGDYGHIFILAGSGRLSGAAALCAEAAMRCGAGLVTVGLPKSVNAPFIKIKLKEVMTIPLAETAEQTLSSRGFDRIKSFIKGCDVVVIGPGLGRHASTQNLIHRLVSVIIKPLILDADALYALSGHMRLLKQRVAAVRILTPHAGEMARLAGIGAERIQKMRKMIAKKMACDYNSTIILKGHRSIVTDYSGKSYTNMTGNPGMATAGSGDVLAGMVAALLGQGLSAFEAARYGVYLHGLAGDLAAREKTQAGMIASDIISKIPAAIKKSLSGKFDCRRSSVGRAAVL